MRWSAPWPKRCSRGIRPRIRIAELPAAMADPSLLRQVWSNLIGNALKYSSKGASPVVEIGAQRAEAGIEYWVRDNGAGFDMRRAAKLFGVFRRLHSSGEYPGTGVGLAIARSIVRRHGGTMRAEGRVGEGATFCFTLPEVGEKEALRA